MKNTSENRPGKYICAGLLAHVDAGKTTLSEGLLYAAGSIRKMGRVDRGDVFLDTHSLERSRGITIFSKQAVLETDSVRVTLLDTPGHVDFSAEMERTLSVLDYAILVVSGADGVQGHTRTLWKLLLKYRVPVFIFVNKMDQDGTDREKLLAVLQSELDGGCVDFTEDGSEEFFDSVAMCAEDALEEFLDSGNVGYQRIVRMIKERKLFPCFFGSALQNEGVTEFLSGILKYMECPRYPEVFGARVFKVSRDAQGNRLVHLKITGGKLRARDMVKSREGGEEKVNQIRIYSGEKYQPVTEAQAGEVCAVTGLAAVKPGDGIGFETAGAEPALEPVLTYRAVFPVGCDPAAMLPKLRMLEEEDPMLHVVWREEFGEIQIQIMGEVQLEVLQSLAAERFGIEVSFDAGSIVYKETIAGEAEGVGHFEPLRHYAEVHLLLKPGERGSGMRFSSDCSEDVLDKNWQRLVLTHLAEKEHRGVLTGSAITDMEIILMSGRAHQKHTEGGDFRQATYRAVRQGLMGAESVLLEPWYEFLLELPEEFVGRAMTDIERMHGRMEPPEIGAGGASIKGEAPVVAMRSYPMEVAAYTRGQGHLSCAFYGYDICHNPEEVLEDCGYDPDRDTENPSGSVFCAHGSGFVVDWDEVPEYMHLESIFASERDGEEEVFAAPAASLEEEWLDSEEVDRILEQASHANKRAKSPAKRGIRKKKTAVPPVSYSFKKPKETRDEYLLVDGYNIIYAWEDLKELARTNMDGARGKLLDVLCDYQAVKKCSLIAVFDAYRVKGHVTEVLDYHNIHVVFTKEAETADQYIEKFAHENGRKYRVTVATSDGVEQVIIRGQGCVLISARELKEEIERTRTQTSLAFQEGRANEKTYLLDGFEP